MWIQPWQYPLSQRQHEAMAPRATAALTAARAVAGSPIWRAGGVIAARGLCRVLVPLDRSVVAAAPAVGRLRTAGAAPVVGARRRAVGAPCR